MRWLLILALFAMPVSNNSRKPVSLRVSSHSTGVAQAVKVTVLSTMLAGDPDRGIGEWGYSALVEVDGRKTSDDTISITRGTPLLSVRALEALGLEVDPRTKRLRKLEGSFLL